MKRVFIILFITLISSSVVGNKKYIIQHILVGTKNKVKIELNLSGYLHKGKDVYTLFGKIWNYKNVSIPQSKYNSCKLIINERQIIVYIKPLPSMYGKSYNRFSIKVDDESFIHLIKNIKNASAEIYIGSIKTRLTLKYKTRKSYFIEYKDR